MGWPQIAIIVIAAMDLGISLAKDGQPRSNWSFLSTAFGTALVIGLLFAGGFFS